jgi:molybdate transport system regulatory protein
MEHRLTLHIRITGGPAMLLGPGRADLLQHIQAQGSIAAAGRQMKMSYKRAWALVEAMNAAFNAPLVAAAKGGAGGGGAKLTAQGAEVLAAYRGLEAAAAKSSSRFLAIIDAVQAVPPEPETG